MKQKKRYYKKSLKVVSIIIMICLTALIYAFIEPHLVQIEKTEIVSNDIPESFDGVTIVFISDIHHGPYMSKRRIGKVVERINKIEPDIILLGGDYVHRDMKYIEPCFNELSKLKAILGVYGVLGNHDHWESVERTIENMNKSDIGILDNSSVWIYKENSRIKIGGVGDFLEDNTDINPTINDVSENDFVILLSHNPDYVEEIETEKIDLMLSGHTHGGQCTLFGLWAPLVPSTYGNKYRTGVIKTDETTLIVTNGIGTITPPVRFFAPPQINVITLKKNK